MKARVKATGEIVKVIAIDGDWLLCSDGVHYGVESLEGIDEPDYWTRLEHQYAGMAVQGILANIDLLMLLGKKKADDPVIYTVAEFAKDYAHALVEKYKKKEK